MTIKRRLSYGALKGKIIAWWSGGITSAVACKLAIEKYGKSNCRIIMIDTKNEHDDTYRFLKDCEKMYGVEIETLFSDKYKNIQETWIKHLSLNTANGAICSYMLKRRVREKWEKENSYSCQIFGFEYDKKEIKRAESLKLNHPHVNPIYPLIENKLTKIDCIKIIKQQKIKIPHAYSMGFNNNNCLKTGCVQGGIGYWQKIKKEMPEIFEKMAKMEHHLTDLKGYPVTMLKDRRKETLQKGQNYLFLKKHPNYSNCSVIDEMKGRKPKPLIDCNSFCGVNDLLEIDEAEKEINIT